MKVLVSGWWFDGYKMEMQAAYEPLKKENHNIDTWIDAVRSGNPQAELAFLLEPTRSFPFARKVNYVRAKPLPLGETMIFVNAPRKALAGP